MQRLSTRRTGAAVKQSVVAVMAQSSCSAALGCISARRLTTLPRPLASRSSELCSSSLWPARPLVPASAPRRSNSTAATAAAATPPSPKLGSKPPAKAGKQRKQATVSPALRAQWEPIIGIETHAQIIANSKLFSGASTSEKAAPNSNVSLIDAAFPGALPMLNKECVAQVIRTGLSIGALINLRSWFERKHYFYCDLPQGYQITQQAGPLVSGGSISVDLAGQTRRIGVNRIQLEQDSGKNVHDLHPHLTYVDLNRAGAALMEIVSEPDIRSSEEAAAYVRKLGSIFRAINTCDARTDTGSLRCDVNVSVRRKGTNTFGQRVEIKNVARVRDLMRAIEFEINRQILAYEAGEAVERETRGFDSANGVTVRLRSKEQLLDYRFFPEPDLPPLVITDAWVSELKAALPVLPEQTSKRLQQSHALSPYDANLLANTDGAAAFFDAVVAGDGKRQRSPKTVTNWITQHMFAVLNQRAAAKKENLPDDGDDFDAGSAEVSFSDANLTPAQLGSILDMLEAETIAAKSGRKLLALLMGGDKREPAAIVEQLGLAQISDNKLLNQFLDQACAQAPDMLSQIAQAPEGKKQDSIIDALMGRALKASGGKANPVKLRELVVARSRAAKPSS